MHEGTPLTGIEPHRLPTHGAGVDGQRNGHHPYEANGSGHEQHASPELQALQMQTRLLEAIITIQADVIINGSADLSVFLRRLHEAIVSITGAAIELTWELASYHSVNDLLITNYATGLNQVPMPSSHVIRIPHVLNGAYSTLGIHMLQPNRTVYQAINAVALSIRTLAQAIGAMSHNQERLDSLAHEDFLVGNGIVNRRGRDRDMSWLYPEAVRQQKGIFTISLDGDFFKRINDTYGHSVGDQVMRHIAGVIQSCSRPNDSSCRTGGEEFTITGLVDSFDDALNIALRIQEAFRSRPFNFPDGARCVSVSMGLHYREHSSIPKGALKQDVINMAHKDAINADEGVYQVKFTGRNGMVAYNGPDTVSTRPYDDICAAAQSVGMSPPPRAYYVDARGRIHTDMIVIPTALAGPLTEMLQAQKGASTR